MNNNKDKKFAFDTMEILIKYYPDARCVLTFNNPFQMLVAVVLSAQCTDERVNMITPGLFKKYLMLKILLMLIFLMLKI